ncbi:MAG: hypothetical protein WC487_04005 [Candidatus Omnitrophota bacterium]
MIVKMKRMTLFVRQAGRRQALEALRSLGVVHLECVKQAQEADMDGVSAGLEQVARAISVIGQYKSVVSNPERHNAPTERQKRVESILSLNEQLKADESELEKVCQHLDWYKPWNGFDPGDIKNLSISGVDINLYELNELEYRQVEGRDDIHVISRDKGRVYCARINCQPGEDLPFKSIALPDTGFDALCRRQAFLEKRIAGLNTSLQLETAALKPLQEYQAVLDKQYRFLRALHGMEQEESFAYIQGYVPQDRCREFIDFARANHAGYLLEEPDNPDDAPTLIRNPEWIDIINPVFQFMNTVPGYAEYDISAWFLLFFSLFFAMLIGDAGYGVIFLSATFIIRRCFKNVAAQPFFLMYVLSTATIIWGAATGTWFGSEAIARLPFLSPLVIRSISTFAADNQNLMIFICFTIGIAHLTLAHVLVALRYLNSLKVLAEIGWILVLWALYFIAAMLVIGRAMPAWTYGLLLIGSLLLLAFSEPQRNIFKAMAASLTNIPLKIVSSFADIVSYLRLFAVGYASVVLAGTFNNITASIGFHSIPAGLASAGILFIGHLLNIVLGFMAVIVHGIRLNMLEFSGQMGMGWSGKEYTPFKE